MVDLSDHGDLMTKFLSLPCPRMFMYGEQNPVAMWERIDAFLTRNEHP